MASNISTLADEDGDFEDWIEIHNPTTETVDLDGWYLTDDRANMTKWRFPAVSLGPGEFLIVFASGKDRTNPSSELHTNFKLAKDGEYLGLVMPDGITTVSEFAPAYPPQKSDISYGRAQNYTILVSQHAVASFLVPSDNTDEATWFTSGFDDDSWSTGVMSLGFQNLPAPVAYWPYDVDASDVVGTNDGILQNGASITGSSMIGAGALSLDGDNDYVAIGDPTTLQITGQITLSAWIYSNATNSIRDIVAKGYSFSPNGEVFLRINNGNYQVGSWDGSNHMASFGGAVADTGSWIHLAGTYDGTNWNLYRNGVPLTSNADATGAVPVNENWAVGASGNGTSRFFHGRIDDVRIYNTALDPSEVAVLAGASSSIGTDVMSLMQNVNASIWCRIDFDVDALSTFDRLVLRMRYEDGFVAYINGVRVAQRNAPSPIHWNSTATINRPDGQSATFEDIDITSYLGLLNIGKNVLAIQGLNDSAGDANFLIMPELIAFSNRDRFGYFAPATPRSVNGRGYAGFVKDACFSIDHGFYDTPFDLVISCETKGSTISYTKDGSEPTLTNGFRVAAPSPFLSPSVTLNIPKTMVVRAAAFKDNYIPSRVNTRTYIFVDDVILQDYQATVDAGFPTDWNGTSPDYGMDPDVIGQNGQDLFGGVYAASIRNDLKAVPTLSIVMNIDDMFGPMGIYSNPTQRGQDWERPASFELIYPDGRKGFQVNAGIRIQGGAFRRFSLTKKNSFRLLFKGIYGPTKLHYPFFGPDATDQFDTVVLRMNSNDGWQWNSAGDKPQYARDEFGRRTQLATGQPSSHGNFMHVYINGFYWGLYNPVERPDASFSATYYGGEKEDWDAINTGGVISGNWTAWNTMLALADDVKNGVTEAERTAAYMRIQGRNPDGTNNPGYEDYLDVDNLIDYMIVNLYLGNTDWPHKNYYFARRRGPESTGFKFYMWDSEWSVGLRSNLNTDQTGVSAGVAQPYDKLKASAEFRLRFADHVHKHFFNGGAMYVDPDYPTWDPAHPERNIPATRYIKILNEIQDAIVGESARWGDQHRDPPYTKNAEWQSEADDLIANYFPYRSAIVLQQFRNAGLYPSVVAPTFAPQHGGVVPSGFHLTISAPAGTIYYTLDGTDPRQLGGSLSPRALTYTGPLTLTHSVYVSARARDGGNWSAMNAAGYTVQGAADNVTISELMYNSPGGSDFEFIELHNPERAQPVLLDGYRLTSGVKYTFPAATVVPPEGYLLVVGAGSAGNFATFRAHYGLGEGLQIVGPYSGNLANEGERITLKNTSGEQIFSFKYDDARGWPVAADGAGHSLVPLDTTIQPPGSLDYGGNWRFSTYINGSPGAPDPVQAASVVLNEIVANTDFSNPAFPDYDSNDWIELYNLSSSPVNLNGWYLSDDESDLRKWAIFTTATIPANGRLSFDEISGFHNPLSSGFGISELGERIFLSHLPGTSGDRVVDAVRFKGQESSVSLGRYPDGGRYWFAMSLTHETTNAAPNEDVVISEFMYHPADGTTVSEYIELSNPTARPIALWNSQGPWRLGGGVDFTFPPNTTIAAESGLLIVHFDPSDAVALNAFKATYGLTEIPAPVLGPYFGNLSNQGERVAIERPLAPRRPGEPPAWVIVDEVIYFDQSPWTPGADGTGLSLQRTSTQLSGNDPTNWTAGRPTPGDAFAGTGYTLTVSAVNGSVGRVPDQATYAAGATVVLTAMPGLGYQFTGWSGDVPSGHETDNPLVLIMDANKTLVAHFAITPTPNPTAAEWWMIYR